MKFAFGDFELNAAQRSLAQAGSVISIEPKAFDVLVFLIKKRDRMVSRDELLEECWAGIYVSDGTLSRCLSRVRQALGQDRKASSPILTVHTKGYRFVEELSFAGDLELEEEITPIDEEPFEAQSLGVERRFVSIVNTVIFSSGVSQEERQQKGLSFAAECRNLAASHGVETLSSSSSEVVIQVGYPRAIERPAAVAVSVAGGIFEAGRKTGLGIRVTVSSGIAVSDDRPDRTTIAGLEPLRIVGSVAPGEAEFLIDDRTAQLVEASTELVPENVVSVTGETVDAWRVAAWDQTQATRRSNTEPLFVGRESEFRLLEDLWRRIKTGPGKIVTISGEAGIGKTGLVQEFVARNAISEGSVLTVRCDQNYQSTPFYPLLVVLRQRLGIKPTTSPLAVLRKIEEFLEMAGHPASDHLPLLASMLSISGDGSNLPELNLSQMRRRQRTMEALLFMITSTQEEGPAVLWVDDIQWADPSSKALLTQLSELLEQLNLMIIACDRDSDEPTQPGFEGAKSIKLSRMDAATCGRLLSDISERGLLPAGLISTIAMRSEGVPLYLREIVRMATAWSGESHEKPDAFQIPDSLQGLLATRLEASGPSRPTIQLASIIGRSFSRDLLLRVSLVSEAELDHTLAILTELGLIRAERGGSGDRFTFTHALLRDAAYESMLLETRREYHLRIAEALCAHFPDFVSREPEAVAIHFAASTEPERAVPYWRAAGDASVEGNAIAEARALFGQALDAAKGSDQEQTTKALVSEIEALLEEY